MMVKQGITSFSMQCKVWYNGNHVHNVQIVQYSRENLYHDVKSWRVRRTVVRQPAVKRCEIDVHSAHHDARLRFKVAIGNFFLHNFCISVPSVILIVILILGKGCTAHNLHPHPSAHFDVSFEIILHRKKMLKTLVCVSCIFLRQLYFGKKSIVNCNL